MARKKLSKYGSVAGTMAPRKSYKRRDTGEMTTPYAVANVLGGAQANWGGRKQSQRIERMLKEYGVKPTAILDRYGNQVGSQYTSSRKGAMKILQGGIGLGKKMKKRLYR